MRLAERCGRAGLAAALSVLSCAAAVQAQDNDLSTIAVTQPVSGCSLTATENVTVRLFNFGPTLPAATSFNVSYIVNGGVPVTELITLGAPLLSNSTLNYTFTTQADLSIPGAYTFDATVALAGDGNPTNDAFLDAVVTNTAPSAGGALAGPTAVCASGNSGMLTLSGHTGNVVRWEYSTDSGFTWVSISNTTLTQTFSDLAEPTLFRAIVQNGSCAPASSTVASVALLPASVGGSVSSVPMVCAGANIGTLVLSGKVGSVVRWERFTDGDADWTPIANTTTTQGFSGVAQTTLYRAVVQSGACPEVSSLPGEVPVLPATVAVTAPGPACPGGGGNVVSATDLGPGVTYAWQAAGGTITAGADEPVATFRAGTGGPVQLSVTATGPGGGCQAVGNTSVPLRFAAGIQGPATACVGLPTNPAQVPDAGVDAIYLWTIANGVLTGGLGTSAVTFQPLGGTPLALQVLVLAQGCIVDNALQLPVASTPPAPVLTAPTAVESLVAAIPASAVADPSNALDWSLTGGTIDAGDGTPEIQFTAGPPGVAQLSVVATTAAGCSSLPASVSVLVRAPGDAPDFFTLAPCRLVDTRRPTGPVGGPALAAGAPRQLPLLAAGCGVPGTAAALAVNVTTIAAEHGTFYSGAGNEPLPGVGLPLRPERAVATQAIVRLATDGTGLLTVGHDGSFPVHLLVDVVGWFQ